MALELNLTFADPEHVLVSLRDDGGIPNLRRHCPKSSDNAGVTWSPRCMVIVATVLRCLTGSKFEQSLFSDQT